MTSVYQVCTILLVNYSKKLEQPFNTFHKPNGQPYSIREVARGTGVSASYISHILNKRRQNPSPEKLAKIAKFFGVSNDYFNDKWQDDTQFLNAIAMRAAGLSSDQKRALMQMIDEIRKTND